MAETTSDFAPVDFRTEPARYRHWKLSFDGPVATLAMDVREDAGLRPGYELKLNSYDLGVDIELYDAVQRLRFEHPEVGAVIVTSGGPITAICQSLLGVPDERVAALHTPIFNASITELLSRPGQVALSSFNGTAHLEAGAAGRELITYR